MNTLIQLTALSQKLSLRSIFVFEQHRAEKSHVAPWKSPTSVSLD